MNSNFIVFYNWRCCAGISFFNASDPSPPASDSRPRYVSKLETSSFLSCPVLPRLPYNFDPSHFRHGCRTAQLPSLRHRYSASHGGDPERNLKAGLVTDSEGRLGGSKKGGGKHWAAAAAAGGGGGAPQRRQQPSRGAVG
eukprot:1618111-Rhodomonas_salina.2